MIRIVQNNIVILLLLLGCHTKAFSDDVGHISGRLILDDSWDRRVYVSFVETFEKEYAVSNNLIITSAAVDSLGDFKIELDDVPSKWSLLRLHVVKKGVSPNSLVIGSRDENYYFLIARRDSEITLHNTADRPIFHNTSVEGAPYMDTFEHIRELSDYPNSFDYENSLIEKEFIKEVVSEKLKVVSDTSTNPLVSLYALYQTDFQADYYHNPTFYDSYLLKWEDENSTYFESFRLKFPHTQDTPPNQDFLSNYTLLFTGLGIIVLIGVFAYSKRDRKIEKLSVQERRIFDLLQNGLSNKEISAECNIELSTVKSHVSNIYSKLKIKSRKEALNLKIR